MRSEEEDWNSDSTQSESELEFDDTDRPNTLAVVDRLEINNELLHFAPCSFQLLDLSFSFPFSCCPFAVELRAPDFAFPIINQVSLQSGIKNSWLIHAAMNAFSRKFKTVLSQALFREPYVDFRWSAAS